jgi:hypothetical protein
LQLVAHEVQLELIRLAHDSRITAAGGTPAASTALAAVALPAHVTAQLVNAKMGGNAAAAVYQSASTQISAANSVAQPGNFLIAAAAQQRSSEMIRKRSRVAARAGAAGGSSIAGSESKAEANAVLKGNASASSRANPDGAMRRAAVPSLLRLYPVIYRCELAAPAKSKTDFSHC